MKFSSKNNQGLIGLIILIIIALIVLGYFGFNVQTIVQSPQVQTNLQYAWNVTKELGQEIWAIVVLLYNNLIVLFKDLATGLKQWKSTSS
jgi:uncharacterized membrane protein